MTDQHPRTESTHRTPAAGEPAAATPAAGEPAADTPEAGTPETVVSGVRWLATAALAVALAGIGTALFGDDGPRAVPLLLVGAATTGAAWWWRRRRPAGAIGETGIVLGAAVLVLGFEALLRPEAAGLDAFLAVGGAALVALGFVLDDRRPVVLGVGQWALAVGRPGEDPEVFRHCLVATDLALPLPRVVPLVALGAVVLAVSLAIRLRAKREANGARGVEAGRGLETTGLGLVLGGLGALALELPGHPLLCGTGDAIDAGWGLALVAVATLVGVVGVRWGDHLWAATGLAAAATFGVVATTIERNPWWSLLVGVPLVGILVLAERAGVTWRRRTTDDLDAS